MFTLKMGQFYHFWGDKNFKVKFPVNPGKSIKLIISLDIVYKIWYN